MIPQNHITNESTEIAEKVRSGEFFRESREMYDFAVHDPMSERYIFLLITGLAGMIFLVALIAVNGLYPLHITTPFIVKSTSLVEDIPHIKKITSYEEETTSSAVLRFIISNYITLREEYNIDTFDRNARGIKLQSAEEVYKDFTSTGTP